MNNSILVTISSIASIPLLESLVHKLAGAGYSVSLCCDLEHMELSSHLQRQAKMIFLFNDIVNHFAQSHQPKFRFKYRHSQGLQAHANNHYLKLKAAKYIIKQTKPSLIISSEDGISGNVWLLGMAEKFNIPRLVCPYGFGSYRDLENALAIKQAANEMLTIETVNYAKILQKRYPRWIKQGKFSGALLFPPEYIIPLEQLGISIDNPWTIHGGNSNAIAVESQRMYAHYLNEGIDESKLNLCGSIYADILFKASAKHMTKENQRTLLFSLLPNYDGERGHLSEFNDYHHMIVSILEYLKSIPNLIFSVSPHPAVDEATINLIKQMNVEVTHKHIVELIPLYDLYLSCFSSTIRWAIASGKPVINYDVYQFDLQEYRNVEAVLTINQFEQFKQLLNKLMKNDEYNNLAALQQKQALLWGMVDGKNFTRINTVIQDLINKRYSNKRRKSANPISALFSG